MAATIVPYDDEVHRAGVIALWNLAFGYGTSHNDPALAIDKKKAVGDGLFFVASHDNLVAGTVMAGYDGHRGWIYSLAVDPDVRNRGIGSQLLSTTEHELTARGCVKINLQIADGNEEVQGFYETNGYSVEKRISMGKRLLR